MSDVVRKGENLPAVVERLVAKVAVGAEKYRAELAILRHMKKADVLEATRIVAIDRVIDDLAEAWKTHAELGRLIVEQVGGRGGYKSGSGTTLEAVGLDKDASRYARGLAEAEAGGYFDKAIEAARKSHAPPRYMQPYVAWKHDNDSPEDIKPLPAGKFAVIMADPPWSISTSDWDIKWQPEDTIANKYPRLSIEAIKSITVEDVSAEDCSLFLWTTHTLLPAALDVMSSWGFKYHCCITWDKGGGFTHCGFHRRTEFLLYGYRGKMNMPQRGEAFPTLIVERARGHSEKPEEAYRLVEMKFDDGRLEMFAREEREGWTQWGNEV